jgi:glycosyltransferase involved in cell wall biosynthesis
VRVLIVHNQYQQPGGEDQVVAAEAALLEANGHGVLRYTIHNDRVRELGPLRLGARTIWSSASYADIRSICRAHRPDIAHFHNTLPLISPSGYYAARSGGARVIQTLHNYRLGCPAALFFRDGHVCEECLGKSFAWPGIAHRCYRASRVASAAVASMVGVHRALGTWDRAIDRYIALTEFARAKFVEIGISNDRITVKPNFVNSVPGVGKHQGGYALFVGRLSAEKGVKTLIQAWRMLPPTCRLKVIGSGPMEGLLTGLPEGVEWLGWQERDDVAKWMRDAAFLVFPSECYEGAALTIIEAYAAGLPVIAANLGAGPELVRDGVTGLLYDAGESAALAQRMRWAFDHPAELTSMQAGAHREFTDRYTPASNYKALMEVYNTVIQQPSAS